MKTNQTNKTETKTKQTRSHKNKQDPNPNPNNQEAKTNNQDEASRHNNEPHTQVQTWQGPDWQAGGIT